MTHQTRQDAPEPPSELTSPFLALPTEIKSQIAASLAPADANNLVLVHTSLVDLAEKVVWSYLKLPVRPRADPFPAHEEILPEEHVPAGQPIHPNVSGWERLERLLLARPVRHAHIQSLRYTIVPEAIPIAARILPRLPNLRCLLEEGSPRWRSPITGDTTNDEWRNVSFALLQQCGPLPILQTVLLRVTSGSRHELFRALDNVPNVVTLCANVELPVKAGNASVDPPHLPHLESLDLKARGWLDTFGPLVSRAPNLSALAIRTEDKELPKLHQGSAQLNAIFRSQSIRLLTLGQEILEGYVLDPRRVIKNWLPNLEILTMFCPPNEDCFPRHPNLRLLTLCDWVTSTVPFGSAPNAEGGVSGLLDQWVEDALDGAPNLLYLDDYNGDDGPPGSPTTMERAKVTGFRFSTFTNGKETLYHARKNVEYIIPETLMLYGEWCMRERIQASALSIDRLFEDSKFESIVSGVYDEKDFDSLFASGRERTAEAEKLIRQSQEMVLAAAKEHQTQGAGADDDHKASLELTVYRDWPLPYAVLAWVYEEAGYEREWKEGKRGMGLPEYVWQYLREWHHEVCTTQSGPW